MGVRVGMDWQNHEKMAMVYVGYPEKLKREGETAFPDIPVTAVFPSVFRTSFAEAAPAGQGSAGSRSSWGYLPFYIGFH